MLHGGGPGYFSTIKTVLSKATHPNLLVMWYEDMKKDQRKMVTSIANHIGYCIAESQVVPTKLSMLMFWFKSYSDCCIDRVYVL